MEKGELDIIIDRGSRLFNDYANIQPDGITHLLLFVPLPPWIRILTASNNSAAPIAPHYAAATVFVATVVLVLASSPVKAAFRCGEVPRLSFDREMQFCMLTDIYISAIGAISQRTPDDFIAFLRAIDGAGYKPHSVTFHSPGGSMVGGITLGRLIRHLGLDTHVGKSSQCSSACMLAFIGGRSRKVTHDGRIGNHQIENRYSDVDSVEAIQDTIGYLSRYHQEMQVSPLAVVAAMNRRSYEIYWYSPEERREWGIVTRK